VAGSAGGGVASSPGGGVTSSPGGGVASSAGGGVTSSPGGGVTSSPGGGVTSGVAGAAVWAAAMAGVSTAITSAARIAHRYQDVRRDPRSGDAPLFVTQPTQDEVPGAGTETRRPYNDPYSREHPSSRLALTDSYASIMCVSSSNVPIRGHGAAGRDPLRSISTAAMPAAVAPAQSWRGLSPQ
jgi:hypothetical protein